MARETKVGLLAGLAFIVCFAVILTNKGQRVPFRPSSQVADATRRSNDAAKSPAREARRVPVPHRAQRQDAPARSPRRFRPSSGSDVVDGDAVLEDWGRQDASQRRGGMLNGGAVELPDGQPDATRQRTLPRSAGTVRNDNAARRNQAPRRSAASELSTSERAALERAVSGDHYRSTSSGTGGAFSPAQTSLASRHGLQPAQHRRPVQEPSGRRDVPPAVRRAPASAGSRGRARLARYTVAPGDTLSRIAANHYGRASRSNIKAIVSANRSTIENPDVLRAGAQIVIPVLDEKRVASARSARQTTDADQSARAGSRAARPGSFVWYQIRPGDRYISIAREQLGDASRWEEIFTLNFDKFPDPGKIRVGVRIKLPVDRSVSAGGRS